MSLGRPSTYDEGYCDKAVAFLAEGYSVAAFAGEIGVAKSTVYEWIDRHPDFSDAVKRGQAKAVLWWEKRNIEFAKTGEGNATSIIFGLKNRASDEWRDKVETEHSGGVTYTKVEREIVRPTHSDS
jgi:transposase